MREHFEYLSRYQVHRYFIHLNGTRSSQILKSYFSQLKNQEPVFFQIKWMRFVKFWLTLYFFLALKLELYTIQSYWDLGLSHGKTNPKLVGPTTVLFTGDATRSDVFWTKGWLSSMFLALASKSLYENQENIASEKFGMGCISHQ